MLFGPNLAAGITMPACRVRTCEAHPAIACLVTRGTADSLGVDGKLISYARLESGTTLDSASATGTSQDPPMLVR